MSGYPYYVRDSTNGVDSSGVEKETVAGFVAPFLDYQICVLVGMGALVASVIGAPIATILIVFELTENYQAATAVMIDVVAAYRQAVHQVREDQEGP